MKKAAWVPMNHLPNLAVSISCNWLVYFRAFNILLLSFARLVQICDESSLWIFSWRNGKWEKKERVFEWHGWSGETIQRPERTVSRNQLIFLHWIILNILIFVNNQLKYFVWKVLVSLFRLYRERISQVEKKLEEVKSGMFSGVGVEHETLRLFVFKIFLTAFNNYITAYRTNNK